MLTTNYGLAGGTLDASEHVERAVIRMLFPSEIEERQALIRKIVFADAEQCVG